MHVPTLIKKKRDGQPLLPEEIKAFIHGVATDAIADYQVAAMLMAIYFQGLADEELAVWAQAMTHSGDVLTWPTLDRPAIDKHSTGGVGDKISLPLAPAVAACGVAVPMISGRGLGHTGGTLDKLEAIPGFRVNLDIQTFQRQVASLGVALIGQTDRLAPADRRLYAIRDVTATVESIPLIASSIMSKKLASGISGLVLDCKVGRGAFMADVASARALGLTIKAIGHAAGCRVTVMLTDMNEPIGATIGNALEVAEALEVLRGKGPADTRELTVALGAEMLCLAGRARDTADGAQQLERVLDNGAALARFAQVIEAQGGDPRVCDEPERLPRAAHVVEVVATAAGFVAPIDSLALAQLSLRLGAGRVRKEDHVDPAAGLEVFAKRGERVSKGDVLARIHASQAERASAARGEVAAAIAIVDEPVTAAGSRILETIR
ncbi:MAG: thymidine phosphorylase [Myxococcales bacterium]|nr:thymidine phosphorylase [Myxococcales bacterium]